MGAPRFAADSNVGRLARWLRILGYDVTYDAAIADGELVRQALSEGRILLTRDTGILRRRVVRLYQPEDGGEPPGCDTAAGTPPGVVNCIFVRHDAADDQLRQVVAEAGLHPNPERFWTRCPVDNTPTHPVSRVHVADRVPPYTHRTQAHFSECPECGRIYWRGSHLGRFEARIQRILQDGSAGV